MLWLTIWNITVLSVPIFLSYAQFPQIYLLYCYWEMILKSNIIMQIPSWNSSMTLLLGKSPNTSASRLLQQDSYLYSLSYLSLVKLWQKQFHEYLNASTAQNAHPSLISLITSVQSCLTLCDPTDCSMPGFPIHHQHPEPTQTTCSLCHWCHPNISSSVVRFSSHLQSFPAAGSFPWVCSLHQMAKVLKFRLPHQSFHWTFITDFL